MRFVRGDLPQVFGTWTTKGKAVLKGWENERSGERIGLRSISDNGIIIKCNKERPKFAPRSAKSYK